jgi:two-component system, NarL family, response regulator NreC
VTKKISVLLVDDHTLVRRGFRRLIEDEQDMVVVGEAGDADNGIRLSRALSPRIVLMDYSLPGSNGIIAARQIAEAQPETLVVMLTMHSGEARIRQAREAGVCGYIEKNAHDMELVSTIRRVANGERVFPLEAQHRTRGTATHETALSERERQILQFIVDGKSNREIAAQLALSVHTVGAHRARIMKALDIHKVTDLVAYAIRNGLA